MRKLPGILAVLLCASCQLPLLRGAPADPPALDPALQSELGEWLATHGKDPAEYVRDLFEDHDVVFVGEYHRILHDVRLVQSLPGPLYEAGVRVLVTEFGDREDQALIDLLVRGPEWNEELARRICFRQYPWWGYCEYVDVYRAAWEVNASRPPGASPFRVLGMNNQDVRSSESMWAEVILDAVNEGEKVLVHCGIHHAFTGYQQPSVSEGELHGLFGDRAGNFVRDALGRRAVTVYLHAPWSDAAGYGGEEIHPADGILDAFMLAREGGPFPVGFDVAGSPFGAHRIETGVYRHGYPDFTPADFCDGWIYTKPISEYEGVTPIEDWINEDNVQAVRDAPGSERNRNVSVGKANGIIRRSADIPRRFAHLR